MSDLPKDPRFKHLLWVWLLALVLALLCSGGAVAAIYWWLQLELG